MRTLQRCLILLAFVGGAMGQCRAQDVPFEKLLHADQDSKDWLMYNGDYQSHRFSQLTEINKTNVASLRPVWLYQPNEGGILESAPVVVNGIMYVTTPPSTVTALDARTGLKLWSWSPVLPKTVYAVGAFKTNRGIAILDDTVYVGVINAHLVALDAKTGAVRWDVEVIDNKQGYAIPSAPMAINGEILIGAAGSEGGVRGFLDAYDAKTGQRRWRLWTMPGPGDPGSETWGKDLTGVGGGTVWNMGSYDPDLNLLYFGTGNPAPDFNGDARPGANLYTCSMIAVDASTGKMKWYFQFTPHETHDWDGVQVPVLFNAIVAGKSRKLLAQADRNGFYYVLDRETGKFVLGVPYVKETWAKGLDAEGNPIVEANIEPSAEGTLLYPDVIGATNYQSPSFDPTRKLFYVNVREMGAHYFKGQPVFNRKGPPGASGGGHAAMSGDDAYGAIRALNVMTGKMKWEFRFLAPAWSSMLSTAGGVVFSETDEGDFFALDSDTGKPLWHFNLGKDFAHANPVTYEVDGKQFVVTSAGNAFVVFGLP
jgi:alcohol dehydrogenase (cytochrome c)